MSEKRRPYIELEDGARQAGCRGRPGRAVRPDDALVAAAGGRHRRPLRPAGHGLPPGRGVRRVAPCGASVAAVVPAPGGLGHRRDLPADRHRGRGHQRRAGGGAPRQGAAASAAAGHLLRHGADPPVRRLRRPGGRGPADGRYHRLPHRPAAAPGRPRPADGHHDRHGGLLLRAVRDAAGGGRVCGHGRQRRRLLPRRPGSPTPGCGRPPEAWPWRC